MRTAKLLFCIALISTLPAQAGVLGWTTKKVAQGAAAGTLIYAAKSAYKHQQCKKQPYLPECQTPIDSTSDMSETTAPPENDPELQAELPLMKNGAKLAKDMEKKGMGTRPKGCSAHHIVPETDKRYPSAIDARDLWTACFGKNALDAAENGVYLQQDKNGPAQCPGVHHTELHNRTYYDALYSEMVKAFDAMQGSSTDKCMAVKNAIDAVRQELLNGSFPR